MTPHKFSIQLPVDGQQMTFEFYPMNIQRPQLYQVYYSAGKEQVRFHMQIDNKKKFFITDPQKVIQAITELQSELSDAILLSVTQ